MTQVRFNETKKFEVVDSPLLKRCKDEYKLAMKTQSKEEREFLAIELLEPLSLNERPALEAYIKELEEKA